MVYSRLCGQSPSVCRALSETAVVALVDQSARLALTYTDGQGRSTSAHRGLGGALQAGDSGFDQDRAHHAVPRGRSVVGPVRRPARRNHGCVSIQIEHPPLPSCGPVGAPLSVGINHGVTPTGQHYCQFSRLARVVRVSTPLFYNTWKSWRQACRISTTSRHQGQEWVRPARTF